MTLSTFKRKPPHRPRKEREPDEFASFTPKPRKAAMSVLGDLPPVPVKKTVTQHSESWLDAVRSLPFCVLCGAPGVEPAHRNEGKGMGLKTHDCWVAGICRTCHREIDQGKGYTLEQRRAEIDRAIVLTLAMLVQEGKVVVRRRRLGRWSMSCVSWDRFS